MSQVRNRKKAGERIEGEGTSESLEIEDGTKSDVTFKLTEKKTQRKPEAQYGLHLAVVLVLSILTRFYQINYPKEVVFDEVHFGKFTSFYLQRAFFFDVHPPLGKLVLAAIAYLGGFDGSFKFDQIAEPYEGTGVPYVAMRSFCALESCITCCVCFLILKNCGVHPAASLLGSLFVIFDNGQATQSRLILLDSSLNLAIVMSVFCYIKFIKSRNAPFSTNWWIWLISTGMSLSCAVSVKYVGLFTFALVGLGTLHELWQLLDAEVPANTMKNFAKHFFARVFALIVIPCGLYLFWFYVHFAILNQSGTGDKYVSPRFQASLKDSPMILSSKAINYYDKITLQHKNTGAFLQSYPVRYPKRYADGRGSSRGQQVTAEPVDYDEELFIDEQEWQILPAKDFNPSLMLNQPVKTGDIFRLYHVDTNTFLMTHDIASPFYSTNEEFTTCPIHQALGELYNATLFKIDPFDGYYDRPLRTKYSEFQVRHLQTHVAMWTHNQSRLPEWSPKQQEVNGRKLLNHRDNLWRVDQITNLKETDPRTQNSPKGVTKMPFFSKWWELQQAMIEHNNNLPSEHPFASHPIQWPFSMKGMSFWSNRQNREHIYFIGNIVAYWIESALIALYPILVIIDKVSERRKCPVFAASAQNVLYNTCGFFFLGWICHYVPFFFMTRQRFLHHYLASQMIGALAAGSLIDFVFAGRNRLYQGAVLVCCVCIVANFAFFSPLTYGVALTKEGFKARSWLNVKLQFAK